MSILEIENLSFSFTRRQPPVLSGFSLRMPKGEVLGVLGPSGSGKSTLLRLIAGLEVPVTGVIRIAGKTVAGPGVFVQPEQRGVGMVFQDYALFPHMTVEGNILLGLHRLPRAVRFSRLREMLELVQMAGYERRYPHELSGGQQQRIALARALAPSPVLLLMDEPFSNLDAALKTLLRQELRRILKKAGTTCLMVTHDPVDIDVVCDRRIVLSPPELAPPAAEEPRAASTGGLARRM